MKHVIYYHTYLRNDGAPLYYYNAMKKMGLDVAHSIPVGDTTKINGKADYHWWIDFGEDSFDKAASEWYPPKDGGKTIYVASDTHLGKDYRFERARNFDYIFFNQLRAYKEFTKLTVQPEDMTGYTSVSGTSGESLGHRGWLPHAVEPQAYPHFEIIKKYDVCFIGHIQDQKNYNEITRVDFLDRMFKEFPNFYFGSRNPAFPGVNLFEDAAKKLSQSRIVLNVSIGDDINMRTWEAMATGSFLLTNYLPTLGELFEDGKHLRMYKTLDEAVEIAKYYLKHEAKREKIAKAGMEEVLSKHTYKHRIEKILSITG